MNNYSFDDVHIGQMEQFNVIISNRMMYHFRKITGDINPLHINKQYAKENGFRGKVVYGLLTTSLFSTLAGVYLPGKKSLIHSIRVSYVRPVYIRDRLEVVGEVTYKDVLNKIIEVKVTINRNPKETVVRGEMKIGIVDYAK